MSETHSLTPSSGASPLARVPAPLMFPLNGHAPWIVSLHIRGVLIQKIWEGRTPLGLGQPTRWMLERTAEGIRVHDLASPIGLVSEDHVRLIPYTSFIDSPAIDLAPGISVRISAKAPLTGKVITATFDQAWVEDERPFKKSVQGCLIALAAFTGMVALWPKPQPGSEALVPEQYAQLVMPKEDEKPAPGKSTPSVEPTQATAATPTGKVVEKTAVVQAFRAKALKSAMSGLLKGGMTTLLAESSYVMGDKANAQARRILDARDESLAPSAELTGLMQAKQVKVAALGGSAGGAKGVGYSRGETAGVKGQGKAQISPKAMADTLGASVQEGLTKDEVGEVIHRHMSEIRYCYESTLIQAPDLEGKLIVNFTIGGSGEIKSSEVKTSTLTDARLDDCVMRRLASWKFPQTKGGIDVAVTYPFIFKMLGR